MHLEYPCAMQRRNTQRRRERYVYTCGVIVAIVFHICTDVIFAAPASYDSLLPQSSEIAEYFSDIAGCYYNFQRYEEGDRIVTNEPCLNCTCHNRMLMCYLRVCPFTKAIGQDCTIEKKPDQCCPIITCPEVPVKLLTSSTTSSPTPTTQTTEVGFHDNYGCSIHDSFYADGAQVPPDPRKPCELCYCIRNRTACVMQECTLHVEGCKPVYQDGVCCPVRYDCDYEKEVASTPLLPTSGGVLKSTTYATVVDCQYGNQSYSDGELITTDKPCEHCYCMRGDIVCAVQDCGEPLRGKDCVPTMPPPERCCPSYYDCPNDTLTTESVIKGSEIFSTEPSEKFSSTDKVYVYEAMIKTERTPVVLSQEQIYEKLGENKKPSKTPLLFDGSNETTTTTARIITTLKPSSKHPSEDILLDTNSVDAGEHFTIASSPETYPSGSYEEITHKGTVSASELYTTIETVNNKSPSPSVQSSTPKQQLQLSTLEQNMPMPTVDSVEVITSEIITSTLNVNEQYSSSHTVSEEAASVTDAVTVVYTKFSESTQTEANEVHEKLTEAFHDNPSVTFESVTNEKFADKATYDTTTNIYAKPDTDENNTPSATNYNQEEYEYTSQPNRYPLTVLESDKSTTIVDKEEPATKFSDKHITINGTSVSGLQNESATESLNTVSDKNTEPLMQSDINSGVKLSEQWTTQQNVQYMETSMKPTFASEKLGGTTESVEEVITTPSSGVVPGEGSCLVDGITHPNTSIIESSNPCHSRCQCLSSIPTCTLVTCGPAPSDPKCMPIQMKPESCCPVYVCEGNEQPLSPQQIPSHNQVVPHEPELPHTTEVIVIASSSFTPAVLSSRTTVQDIKFTEKSPESAASVAPERETPTPTADEITESTFSDSKPQNDLHVPESLLTTEAVVGETKHPHLQNENQVVTTEAAASEETIDSSHKNVSDNNLAYSESTTLHQVYGDGSETQVNTEPSLQTGNDVVTHKHHLPSSSPPTTTNFENEVNEITTSSSTTAEPVKDVAIGDDNEVPTESAAVENNEVITNTNASAQNEKFGGTPATVLTTKNGVEEANDVQITEYYSMTSHITPSYESSHAEEHVDATEPTASSSTESQDEYSSNASVSYPTPVSGADETNEPEEQNNEGPTTITPSAANEDESSVIVTEAVSSSSWSNKLSEISVATVTTIKIDSQNESIETTSTSHYENVDYTTVGEKDQTVLPVSEYPITSKPSSSFFTTIVIPESVKLTEKIPVDVTETYESIATGPIELLSEMSTVKNPDSASKSSIVEDSKPSTEADFTMITSSSSSLTSDQMNEVNSLGPNININSNKFGTVLPTEHSTDLPLATDSGYSSETTVKPSQSYVTGAHTIVTEFVDIKKPLGPSSSPASEIIGEPIVTTSIPVSLFTQENVPKTKPSETNDIKQQEITTNQPLASSESNLSGAADHHNYVTTITENKVSNLDKLGSAITNPTLLETSSENNYNPVQQSTWTRKPVDEVTSEPNYYPQAPMYPSGIENSNEEGTGMEEYDEENNAFGPGTCRYAGKVYVSAQQIPRDDPCDFCFCFRSDIICLQQSCPPPIYGCRQEPIQGFCCPRYECPVTRDAALNSTITTTTTTQTTTALPSRPPRFPLESYRSSNRRTGCVIHGYFYNVGDNIAIASGPCLECICGSDGRMKCDPKSCSPEPYVQQMMAESAFHS